MLLLALSCASALAGGRGGYNTTFDPNSYGGGWACFFSLASGKCGSGTFVHYGIATCDGVTDDTPAETDFRAWGLPQNPAQVKLYITPGSNCVGPGCFVFTCVAGDPGINNIIIWAYGAVYNNWWFGGSSLWTNNLHQALFHTNNIGDQSVSLVNASDGSIFSVGDWVLAGGLAAQGTTSYPMNVQYYEYRIVTAKSACLITCVITLSSPLANQYLETWPLLTQPVPQNGPATLFELTPAWNVDYTVFGIKVLNPNLVNVIGRSVKLYDTFVYQPDPSTSLSVWNIGGFVGSPEVDKQIDFLEYFRTQGKTYIGQNPSPNHLVLDSTSWLAIAEIGANASILNTTVSGGFKIGPGGGHGGTFSISNSTWASIQPPINNNVQLSWVSYSNGTFSIPLTSPQYLANVVPWGVPGAEYGMADSDGTINSIPLTTFKITAVRSDATNAYYDTGSWVQAGTPISTPATLPSPTCSTHACFAVTAYPGTSLIERFIGSSVSQQQFFPIQ